MVEDLRDFSWRETTQDQKRIERYLKEECCRHSVLLHVGIGNSGLARNFCSSVSGTVGITIQENELHHALGLRIRNYFPLIMNKYSMELANGFAAGFDFVIDNNPSTFCCCFWHFIRMMTSYRSLLRSGGQIVTDRGGLCWTMPGSNPRWSLNFADWMWVARALGMIAEDVNGDVYMMRSPR